MAIKLRGTPLHLRLFSKIASLFFPLFLFAATLEVSLPTQRAKAPIYITDIHAPPSEFDFGFLEKLRQILVFDLNTSGSSKVIPKTASFEKLLNWPEVRSDFDLAHWKKEKIPFVVAIQLIDKRLQLTVFDVGKGSSKRYPGLILTGSLDQDRREVHRLASLVQHDLFGTSGVSALKIIYAKRFKSGSDWKSELWMCDSDGLNDRQVISDEGYCVSPAFFPHEKEFYYVSYREGQSKIYRASIGSHDSEILVQLRGSQVLPSVNRKGDQVAFITDATGSPELFIQNLGGQGKAAGKPRQIFSAPKATQASPTYSPDGKKIAFVSDKGGSPRIYVTEVSLGGAEPRLLTRVNRENTSPSWSPDGTKIAYSAKVEGVRQIWIYDFASDEERSITTGNENKENPTWAPDSLHLVYNTESNEKCELYRIHVCQTEPILITKGPHQKRFASWVF